MNTPKRKVTDLLPTEAILISSDADLKVLEEFEKAGIVWYGSRHKPTEWNPTMADFPFPFVIVSLSKGLAQTCEVSKYRCYPATDFIPTEATECDKWCGENYCDTNGCVNRKRNLVNEPIPTEAEKVEVDENSFWKNLSEEKPHSYKTGHWDGMMSDTILFADINGLFYVGKCYQGIMDGSKYIDFYDQNDFEVHNVTHWAKIPSLF